MPDLQNNFQDLDNIKRLQEALEKAETIIIGAGAGLSSSAGFTYSGERFNKYFKDFSEKYKFSDMYQGGFYPYGTLEEYWAYWSRYIFINRYMDAPKAVYHKLYNLVKEKNYFVLTTNVDHCFQKAGFDKKRLFYTQGDYGLFQCSIPCHQKTYDNKELITNMLLAQGYIIEPGNKEITPASLDIKMEIPEELIPHCPVCGKPMSMNLRADNTFVQDSGWYDAAARYNKFLQKYKNTKILFMELGVGYNTPGIIKYPFWQMTSENPDAVYACINYNEAAAPQEIQRQSVCINGDIGEILQKTTF